MKKAELYELGKLLDVRVNSRDKKDEMIEKLWLELSTGARFLMKPV